MAIEYPIKKSLGADVNNFPKVQQAKIKEIIDAINDLIDGSISTTDLTLSGTLYTDTIAETTSAAGVTIDSVLLKDGLVNRKVSSVSTNGTIQTLNCGGSNVIFLTSTTGADLARLSNSAINDGHQLTLVHAVDGGEITLSKLNAGDGIGFTTVTFTDAGDTATFVWSSTSSAWFIVGVNGAVVA